MFLYTSFSTAAEATVQTHEKGELWDWGRMEQDAFQQAKLAVKQAQALGIFDPTLPAKLDVHVTQDGFGWGLWQRQSSVRTPIGFWSQVWHGAEERYSMIEKQLLAAYSALQVVELITQTAEVIIKTTLPIQGWVKDLTHLPKTGVAQAQMVARWVAYLSQRSSLSSSPLKEELQKILGPVMYHSDAPKNHWLLHQRRVLFRRGNIPFLKMPGTQMGPARATQASGEQ